MVMNDYSLYKIIWFTNFANLPALVFVDLSDLPVLPLQLLERPFPHCSEETHPVPGALVLTIAYVFVQLNVPEKTVLLCHCSTIFTLHPE